MKSILNSFNEYYDNFQNCFSDIILIILSPSGNLTYANIEDIKARVRGDRLLIYKTRVYFIKWKLMLE